MNPKNKTANKRSELELTRESSNSKRPLIEKLGYSTANEDEESNVGPHCVLPEHYFDRYHEKSAFNGAGSLAFEMHSLDRPY